MKTLNLLLTLVAAGFLTAAQAQVPGEIKKQTGDEGALEVLFAPLGASAINLSTGGLDEGNLGLGGIKYRRFTSETTAWRVTVLAGFSRQEERTTIYPFLTELPSPPGFRAATAQTDRAKGKGSMPVIITKTALDLMLIPGIEKHFLSSEALSPYMGAEVYIGFFKRNEMWENDPDLYESDYERETKRGSMAFGANAFAGIDWYFVRSIYLGVELGFGAQFANHMDTEISEFWEGMDDPDEVTEPGGSSFGISPNAVGKLRLGFLF